MTLVNGAWYIWSKARKPGEYWSVCRSPCYVLNWWLVNKAYSPEFGLARNWSLVGRSSQWCCKSVRTVARAANQYWRKVNIGIFLNRTSSRLAFQAVIPWLIRFEIDSKYTGICVGAVLNIQSYYNIVLEALVRFWGPILRRSYPKGTSIYLEYSDRGINWMSSSPSGRINHPQALNSSSTAFSSKDHRSSNLSLIMQFNLNFVLVSVLAALSVGANACKNGMLICLEQ